MITCWTVCDSIGHSWVRTGLSSTTSLGAVDWGPWHCERCWTLKSKENAADG